MLKQLEYLVTAHLTGNWREIKEILTSDFFGIILAYIPVLLKTDFWYEKNPTKDKVINMTVVLQSCTF